MKRALKAGEKAALVHAAQSKCYNLDCTEPLFVVRNGHQIINYEIAHLRDEVAPVASNSDVGWRFWPDDIS